MRFAKSTLAGAVGVSALVAEVNVEYSGAGVYEVARATSYPPSPLKTLFIAARPRVQALKPMSTPTALATSSDRTLVVAGVDARLNHPRSQRDEGRRNALASGGST